MANLDTNRGFGNVDQTKDPSYYARFMSQVAALPAALAYKRRSFELLEPRPRGQFLDLGCGPGQDVFALATLVQPHGRVVGVDNSQTMLATAQEQAVALGLPTEFVLGDTHRLDFPDATFDGCRADRVLHHLANPAQALRELVRVAQPGARIVVFDPDFDAYTIDSPNRDLTRKLIHLLCDTTRNGWMGRQLPRHFQDAGLIEVSCEAVTVVLPDYALANQVVWLGRTVAQAREAGLASDDELTTWLEQLREADRQGRFFATVMGILASGRKPRS